MKELIIGSRGGWPGTTLEKLTAHAVYKIIDPEFISFQKTIAILSSGTDPDRSVSLYRKASSKEGIVYGYGRLDGKGQIVNDADGVPEQYRTYAWITPTLMLSDSATQDFEECARYQAGDVSYTGVGGNCFTAVVKALADLRGIVQRENADNARATLSNIDTILQQLGGMNLGMGTSITNEGLIGSSALFQIQAFAQKNLSGFKQKTD